MRLLSTTAALLLGVILCSSCSTVELATVTDREFVLTGTGTPFNSVLIAYDGAEVVDKDAYETAFAEYVKENTAARPVREIELFPPMRKLDLKQKAAIIKDEGVECVLVINGGGLSRPQMWSATGASSMDDLDAWRSMQFRLVQVSTGTVIWMGKSVESVTPALTREDLKRDLVASVGAEMLKHGYLAVRQSGQQIIRGFNR